MCLEFREQTSYYTQEAHMKSLFLGFLITCHEIKSDGKQKRKWGWSFGKTSRAHEANFGLKRFEMFLIAEQNWIGCRTPQIITLPLYHGQGESTKQTQFHGTWCSIAKNITKVSLLIKIGHYRFFREIVCFTWWYFQELKQLKFCKISSL